MGTQKGIIKLGGSVDGLSFYKAYGKDLVRRSSGPSKELIMSGAKFKVTRQNLSEFAGCSKIAKSFRTSLGPVKPFTDGQYGNRLTRLFRLVTHLDEGVRGKRPIRLSNHRDEFAEFECNIKYKLSKIIPGTLSINHNAERTQASVTIPAGQIEPIQGPEGATHFRLIHALGIVSDFVYNARTKGYRSTDPDFNTRGEVRYSAHFPIIEDEISPEYTSTITLPVAAPLPD